MTSLQQRIVTAVVLVAVLLATLFLLPPFAPVVLLGSFLLVGAWEWSGFFLAATGKRLAYVAVLAAGAAAGTLIADTDIANAILLLAVCWWLGVIVWLFRGATAFGSGFCFIAGCMGLLPAWVAVMRLFDCSNGSWLFVWVVAIVAAADIGAFFTGKAFGRTKLAPQISPGKTREGLVGGVLSAAIAAAVGALVAGAAPAAFAAAGAVMALVSVAGDLSVSVWKRRAGLKDSGRLLPGHGGIMDRVDSLVAVLPLFVLLLFVGGQAVEGTCRLY